MQRALLVAPWLALAFSSVLSWQAAAQSIRGQLIDRNAGAPIPHAVVALVDSSGTVLLSTLSSSGGQFFFEPREAGAFALKAERIGYETTQSEWLMVEKGDTLLIRFEAEADAIALDGIEIRGSRRCDISADHGSLIESAWREAMKGLRLAELATSRPSTVYEYSTYLSELDRTGSRRTREISRAALTGKGRIYKGVPIERIADGGYHDGAELFVPTVGILLTDFFLSSHCFEFVRSDAEGLLIGFQPTPERRVPEITGTVQLDADRRIRRIEFQYVNLGGHLAEWPPRGAIEFDITDDGELVLRRWFVRTPHFVTGKATSPVVGINPLVLQSLYEEGADLIQIRRAGTIAESVLPNTDAVASSAVRPGLDSTAREGEPKDVLQAGRTAPFDDGAGALIGRVIDDGTGNPVVGALVSAGTVEAVSDERGRFALRTTQGATVLTVTHIAYGTLRREVEFLRARGLLEIRLSPSAIGLRPIDVTVAREDGRAVTVGSVQRRISEPELMQFEQRGARVEDVLRARMQGVSVASGVFSTEDEPFHKRMLCIESSRGATRLAPPGAPRPFCDMVTVVIDGVVVASPGEYLYQMGLQDFTEIEYLNGLEAGWRFGLRAGHTGALLLRTKRGSAN